jgi:hypothetical protein
MEVRDAQEANQIVQGVLLNLGQTFPQQGRPGSDARTAIGDLKATSYVQLRNNTIGPPLQDCFEQAQAAGASLVQIGYVRRQVEALPVPVTVGGTIIKNSCIELCLATQAEIITAMTFTSRQDVDIIIATMKTPFDNAVTISADEMDQETFQALLGLWAATTNYLVTTARPLPRMINYEFASVLPTLVIAHRLYQDAGRADQVRDENKIIHPAFCPVYGQALSS